MLNPHTDSAHRAETRINDYYAVAISSVLSHKSLEQKLAVNTAILTGSRQGLSGLMCLCWAHTLSSLLQSTCLNIFGILWTCSIGVKK